MNKYIYIVYNIQIVLVDFLNCHQSTLRMAKMSQGQGWEKQREVPNSAQGYFLLIGLRR